MLNNLNRPKYGQIWMCHIRSEEGSIQNGYRPVFILSNNKNNTYAPTVNIIPLTSKMNKRRLPVHVEIWNYKKYGLQVPSTMLVEQIMTVTMDSLDRYIGAIDDEEILNDICKAMCIQFPIFQLVAV